MRGASSGKRTISVAALSLFTAVLLPITLFLYCLSTDSLPAVATSVELLFPYKASTLTAITEERHHFEDLSSDFVVLCSKTPEFWKQRPFFLEDIENNIFSSTGIAGVLSPSKASLNKNMGLVSGDRSCIRLLVQVTGSLSEREKLVLHERLSELLQEIRDTSDLEVYRVGSFVTAQEVASVVQQETSRIIPYVVLALFVVAMLLIRSLLLAAVIVGTQFLAFGVSLLTYSLCGYELGPISQLAQPFLLAVGTSFHLHVACRYMKTSVHNRKDTERELRTGLSLATLTTIISLVSLSFLNVVDVMHFACLTSGGVLLSFLYATFVLPRFLDLLPGVGEHEEEQHFRFPRLPKPVMVLGLLVCVVLGSGVLRLIIHTDPMSFLPEDNVVKENRRMVQTHFSGGHYLRLLAIQKEGQGYDYRQIPFDALVAKLQALPQVTHVLAPIHFESEQSNKALQEIVSDFSLMERSVPSDILSSDERAWRVFIETGVEGKELLELVRQIEAIVKDFSDVVPYKLSIVSQELILAEQTDRIVRGLVVSLGVSVLLVFLLLFLVFRDVFVACIGIVPNLVPLFCVFGVLGYTSRYLDFGSCLVASSVLGIAVDNTFHFLLTWKQRVVRNGEQADEAADATVDVVTYPFSVSSLSLIVSFSLMAFSVSQPVAHFGLLLAIALGIGLFADLYVLPFLLSLRAYREA